MYPAITFSSIKSNTTNNLAPIEAARSKADSGSTDSKYPENIAPKNLNYIYDPVGNIVEMTDGAQSTNYFDNSSVNADGKYEYDPLYRLLKGEGRELIGLNTAPTHTDVSISALNETAIRRYTQEYEYDELGNILKVIHTASGGNWTRHYHYNAGFTDNLLQSVNNSTTPETTPQYEYDAHGSMTKMQHLSSMTWDYADRLQSAANGTQTSYYTYDAGGDRVRKVVDKGGGLIHERIYLGDWEVYREIQTGTVNLERETLHISDDTGRITVVDTETTNSNAQTTRYQYSNHLGSASLECDESTSANIISYEEYHPFGSTSYRSGTSAAEVSLKRYRYVGKERDDETGLYYYGARYYAAWLARFISVDPLKDKFPYLASYQYASNDPVGDIDIDGLESRKELDKPPILPLPDNLAAVNPSYRKSNLISSEIQQAVKAKEKLAEFARELISDLMEEPWIESKQENSDLDLKTLAKNIKKTKSYATKSKNPYEQVEQLDDRIQAHRDRMMVQGQRTYSNGKNVTTSRRNKFGEPVHMGYKNPKTGKLITTKNVVPTNKLIKKLVRKRLIKSISKEANIVLQYATLAQVYAGLKDPSVLSPFEGIDLNLELETELDLKTFDQKASEGYSSLMNAVFLQLEIGAIYLNEQEVFSLLTNENNSIDKIQAANGDPDNTENRFAIVFDKRGLTTDAAISPLIIFYNEHGFNEK